MDLIPRKVYFDDLFDVFETNDKNMKCDIYEKDNNYHIEMDIPGFAKEDIKIECNNGTLTISAKKNTEDNDESKNYIRRERSYREFSRSFTLGDTTSDEIDASYKDGTLSVIIPKIDTEKSKKYIEIK